MYKFFLPAIAIFLIGLIISQASGARLHPFYVSIITIDHSPQSSRLEVTFKIFTDDLENGIEHENQVKLKLATEEQIDQANELISAYLKEHFKLKINGQGFSGKYLGFEPEYDVTRIYVEYVIIAELVEIEVMTDLLTEVISDQSNIVHVNYAGKTKSLMLNARNTGGKLLLK